MIEFAEWLESQLYVPGMEAPAAEIPDNNNKGFFNKSGKIVCISAFKRDNPAIRKFALASPENFAQVALFSPLSARVLFNRHYENFPVLIHILRTYFENKKVTVNALRDIISALSADKHKYHKLSETISGFKYDTIEYVWNNKKRLYQEATNAYSKNDMISLLKLFNAIPGVAPVKAGFMAQLIFGKLGCLDTHNIDMYTYLSKKLGWGLEAELNPNNWDSSDKGIQAYHDVLEKLADKGIEVGALWDIWVDFVGELNKGLNIYAKFGPALNPHDEKYKSLLGEPGEHKIKKTHVGIAGDQGRLEVPVASGSDFGRAVSLLHLMASHPNMDELTSMMKRLQREKGENWLGALVTRSKFEKDIEPNLLYHANRIKTKQDIKGLADSGKVKRIEAEKAVDFLKNQGLVKGKEGKEKPLKNVSRDQMGLFPAA